MDFLDFIRKVAEERKAKGLVIKGGKGSGWFAPPKGTHVGGVKFSNLTGSEKQVKWAKSIRQKMIGNISRELDYLESANLSERVRDLRINTIKANLAEMAKIKSAKWWIDNRGGITSIALGRSKHSWVNTTGKKIL